ncbi:glycoside hydrolase [Pseudovirgaria hyperparasitica]|uniref:Glycoside hydrolase n=1 Tax=Pseudovirgaria hyperparasitica TaxID=470096 RepID=A0A6A6W0V3_9PEZI|nr:glycoside hydrolase [Pseudovirgaria hyperparasitica]KAF2755560.1 glycoside hydrolase [Pseudovirgaria hyperparasitica]
MRSNILARLIGVSLVPLVSSHGHVSGIVADGIWYSGYDPAFAYANPIPKVAGWTASNIDNGFIAPDAFGTSDIICHKNSSAGQAYVTVKAGGKLVFQWSTWPVSHVGPVIDYIAPCTTSFNTTDPTKLKFVKLDAGGWISGSNPGKWATDTLIASNTSWAITVPAKLAPGDYVFRHEIIALHSAGQTNGAQAYPQCVNVRVTGAGTAVPSGGVSAVQFYKASDPGIKFDVYTSFTGYVVPGPAVWTAVKRAVEMVW